MQQAFARLLRLLVGPLGAGPAAAAAACLATPFAFLLRPPRAPAPLLGGEHVVHEGLPLGRSGSVRVGFLSSGHGEGKERTEPLRQKCRTQHAGAHTERWNVGPLDHRQKPSQIQGSLSD